MGVGLSVTATVDRLWVGYLTYGLGVGIGVACGYVPMLAVVGGWFERRRTTALGIAVAGIGLGTLAVAPVAAASIDRYGWRATYVGPPIPPASEDSLALRQIVRTMAFASLYVSTVLASMALFVPFVLLPAFAEERGAAPVAGAALVGLIGFASVVGRLAIGFVADRLGRVRSYQACLAVMAGSFLLWFGATEYSLLVIFAIVLGVGYGASIALNPAVIVEMFGVQGLGRLVGLIYTSAAIGSLAGPPAAGLLIDVTGTYRWAIAGCFILATGALLALVPLGSSHRPGPARVSS